MKLARILAAFAALLVGSSAFAQMGGGGHGSGGMGGSGMGGPGMGAPMGGPIAVAPDGKAVYVKRTTTTSGSTTTTTIALVAIGTNGNVAWTYSPAGQVHDVVFPTGLVAFAVTPQSAPAAAAASSIVALNLSTGAAVWTLEADGMAGDLAVAPSGLYATVMKSAATGTLTGMSRTLLSITLSGAIAWSVPLD